MAPRGTEELRTKYKLMSVHWEMIACKKKETPCLQDYVSSAWTDVIDYLLGEEVWLLRARDSNGQKTVAPSWAALLGYEHEIRIFANKQINLHDKTLVQALALAMNDVRTYQLQFCNSLTQDRDTVKVQERRSGRSRPRRHHGRTRHQDFWSRNQSRRSTKRTPSQMEDPTMAHVSAS